MLVRYNTIRIVLYQRKMVLHMLFPRIIPPKSLANRKTRLAIMAQLEKAGVRIIDPETTFIEKKAVVEPGVTIWPHTYILGKSIIGAGVVIRPETVILNAKIGENTVIESFSFIRDSLIGKDCVIGPFAHIREHSVVEDRAKIGKAEVVRSVIGEETVAIHECYIGDAQIGKRCNIGADTTIRSRPETEERVVFCNFDGSKKHKTLVGDDVFIGSGTKIIAPRFVGRLTYIAAGSVITQDVPDPTGNVGTLVVTRFGTQEHKQNRVKKTNAHWRLLKKK